MSAELASWERKYFAAPGGRPFLFYVAFGTPDGPLSISRSEYRCAGMPAGLTLNGFGPDTHPGELDRYRNGFLWDELQRHDAALAATIAAETHCLRIDADLADSPTLDYFRDTIGLITYLLDHGCSAVYDPFMLRYWSKDRWRSEVFEPADAAPRHHVMILYDSDGLGTEWFHTRGMRKFGRPDLSVRGTPARYRESVIELISRFIEFQAFGGIIDEGHEIRVDMLPDGMRCHLAGDLDDADFNNVHVEIEWPVCGEPR